MAEKKKNTKPKKDVKKDNIKSNKSSKNNKKIEVKEVQVLKTEKKQSKFKQWFNNLSIEKILVYGIIIIIILLVILIGAATKNTKTKNGDDIVVTLKGKTITADDLYKELKSVYGKDITINLVDKYILDKEYKTTDDMEDQAEATINSYKNSYGDNFESFLEYNGMKDEKELKELLIKETKLTNAIKDYVKDSLKEKELKEYYETSIHGDIEAKHILISTEVSDDASEDEKSTKEAQALETAQMIIQKLKDGENFDDLAKQYSDDTQTKENGGQLGYFNTGEMVQEFEDAAYKLEVNEYTTEPVKTTYGYHIIMKTNQKEKSGYEKSKDTIIEKLVAKKQEEDENIRTKAIISLRKKYKMNIKDKKIKSSYNSDIKKELSENN